MPDASNGSERQIGSDALLPKALAQACWQAWIAKGRAQDRRASAVRTKAVKWISVAVLLAAAGLWSHLLPYDVVVRFVVALSAIVISSQSFHARHYALAAVFAALALLYNPLMPIFGFSGQWGRALVFISTVPFIASLVSADISPAQSSTPPRPALR